jgi:hypothetical protein
MRAPMTAPVRARLSLLAVVVHVAFLIWQAPHTVHHFFEPEVDTQHECAFAGAVERSAGTTVTIVGIVPVAGIELSVATVSPSLRERSAPSVLGPRAPPPSAA